MANQQRQQAHSGLGERLPFHFPTAEEEYALQRYHDVINRIKAPENAFHVAVIYHICKMHCAEEYYVRCSTFRSHLVRQLQQTFAFSLVFLPIDPVRPIESLPLIQIPAQNLQCEAEVLKTCTLAVETRHSVPGVRRSLKLRGGERGTLVATPPYIVSPTHLQIGR